MFFKIVFFLIIFSSGFLHSEYSALKWYFGYNAGLNFVNGVPEILSDGKTTSNEGVATITDEFGNLLFYSDGRNIWNKKHQIMENGGELLGDFSSTNAAYVVPHPHNDKQFYLFTTDESENQLKNGLCYNIIDMAENQGLGKIIQKNQKLNAPNTEKIIAIPKENQPSYWIITHDWGESDFLIYNLDPNGLEFHNRIQSGIFQDSNFTNFSLSVGYIKYHSSTKKLALAVFGFGFYLFDFNPQNGFISNQKFIKDSSIIGAYGLEFSENGRFLYTTSFDTTSRISALNQFDLENIDNQENDFKFLITLFSYASGAIQRAENNKIYVATDDNQISVINNPNEKNSKCEYLKNEISLLPNQRVKWGFPRAVPQLQTPKYRIIHNSPLCKGDSLIIEANIINGLNYRWRGPDNFNSENRKIIIPNTKESNFGFYVCDFIIDGQVVFQDSIEAKVIEENFFVDKFNTELGNICQGYSLHRNFNLLNDSEFQISIKSIYLQKNEEYKISFTENLPLRMNAFASVEMNLFFTSEIPGYFEDNLVIEFENSCGEGLKKYKLTAQVLDANIEVDRSYLNFGTACLNEEINIKLPIINDSGNDIKISEMFFAKSKTFQINDTIKQIKSKDIVRSSISFKASNPGLYIDTLYIVYDLTCERGIRAYEFRCEVPPFELEIEFPKLRFFQGADTCFYVNYNSNCSVPEDFELKFDLNYNAFMFYMQFVENASIVDSSIIGNIMTKSIIIDNFNYFQSDTLFKICGNVLLSPSTLTELNASKIEEVPNSIITSKAGEIQTDEICMQEVMQIALFTKTLLEINNLDNGDIDIYIKGEEKGDYELLIINNLSSVIYSQTWKSSSAFEKNFIVNNLASGVYFVILQTPLGFKFTRKLIVVN